MFITVKYGNNETLLCNPSCAVVNLLNSIRRRTGYVSSGGLDLSDETGLVKELDLHRHEHATKFLASHATYILVEKQLPPAPDEADTDDGASSSAAPSAVPPHYVYTSLLDNCGQLFPNFRLRVQTVERRKKHRSHQSPSPAGVRGVKGRTAKEGKVARAPSRKR